MKLQYTVHVLVIELIINIFLVLFCFKQMLDKNKQKSIIRNLSMYNETLNHLYDGIRCFKHDFVNFIQSLEGYVKCNDMDGIRMMTDAIYTECRSICNLETLNPEMINNPAIYNLLVNKYKLACNKKIIMNIEVQCDLDKLNIDDYHLCRILGILVDNAIEAVKTCKEKIINIRFFKESDVTVMIVENSYQKENLEISKIFEKGYSTKTDHVEHGLGLWKVKEIVDHTDNLEMVTNQGDLFYQELKIKPPNKNLAFFVQNDKILLK